MFSSNLARQTRFKFIVLVQLFIQFACQKVVIIHYSLLAKTIYTQYIYGAMTIKRWHVIVWKVIKTVETAGLRGRIVKDRKRAACS